MLFYDEVIDTEGLVEKLIDNQSLNEVKVGVICFIFDKNGNYFKANLLKGRDAKPEGAKVRKFDQVSRLPLFPYHHNIWKRCLNKRDSDTFYTI